MAGSKIVHMIKKNNQNVWAANVLVYTDGQDTLWSYRNLLNTLEAEHSCKFNITLTMRLETVLEVSQFLPGGVDIYISDSEHGRVALIEKQIRKKSPDCYIIQAYEKKYVCTRMEKEEWQVERLISLDESLKKKILEIWAQLLKDKEKEMWEMGK